MTNEQERRKLNLRKESLELDILKTKLELESVLDKIKKNSDYDAEIAEYEGQLKNKKYGWVTAKNNFERYYLRQLKSFMTATDLFTDIRHLTEESSVEEISKVFDELIAFLEVVKMNKDIRHHVFPKGIYSDSYKYKKVEKQNSDIR